MLRIMGLIEDGECGRVWQRGQAWVPRLSGALNATYRAFIEFRNDLSLVEFVSASVKLLYVVKTDENTMSCSLSSGTLPKSFK